MPKFIPMINCGYAAGQTPMVWKNNPKFFDTEEECDTWIDANEDWFAPNEFGGGIYAYELNEEGVKFYQEQYKC